MLYFKHECSDRIKADARLIIRKYGIKGYGVYTVLKEIVGEYVKADNQAEWGMVDPMYDVELLADECHVTVDYLKGFLTYCDERQIFQKKDGRLFWQQINERLDEYAKKIQRRKDIVRTKSGQGRDKIRNNRIEQNRIEQSRVEKEPCIINSQEYLRELPLPDLKEIEAKYQVSVGQIKAMAEKILLYCQSKGKKYSNYKATLQNWLLKDYGLRKVKVLPKDDFVYDEASKTYKQVKNSPTTQ